MDAGRRDLTVKVLSKLFHVSNKNTQPNRSHRQYCRRAECWQCSKDRQQFYYQLVMLTLLCATAACVVFLVPSVIIKAGAAVALWTVLRAFTKQLAK